jgi:hypothetical protein
MLVACSGPAIGRLASNGGLDGEQGGNLLQRLERDR